MNPFSTRFPRSPAIALPFFAVLISVFVSSASADDKQLTAHEVGEMSIEELSKVTIASFAPESSLSTDVNISVFEAADWERRGARRTADVFTHEPGVMVYSTLGGSQSISIRGYTTTAANHGISTLLDGVPLNAGRFGSSSYGVPNWGLGTLSRIELMKGPGSSLYGSDALHGAIDMRTVEGKEDFLTLEASPGPMQYQEAHLSGSRALSDTARITFAGAISRSDDENTKYPASYRDFGTYRNEYLSESGVAKLQYKPTDRLKLELGGYGSGWNTNDFQGFGTFLTHNDRELLAGRDLGDSTVIFKMGRAAAEYKISEAWTADALFYGWQQKNTWEFPFIDLAGGTFAQKDDLYSKTTEERYGGRLLFRHDAEPGMPVEWVFGYSAESIAVPRVISGQQSDATGQLSPSFNPTLVDASSDSSRTVQAVLFQGKYKMLDERLTLRVGGRYDHYSDVTGRFTPRFGASYLLNSETALKVSYGSAFRAPTFGEQRGAGTTAPNPNLDPEDIRSVEAGIQHETRASQFTFSVYYDDLSDGINPVPNPNLPPPSTSRYENFESADSIGAEFDGRTLLDERFILGGGYGYVRSRSFGEMSHDYSAFPHQQIFTETGYKFREEEVEVTLFNRILLNMNSSPYATFGADDSLRNYWRADLHLSKRFCDDFAARLNIRNLFDRYLPIPSQWGVPGGYPEDGVSVLLSFEYRPLAASREGR